MTFPPNLIFIIVGMLHNTAACPPAFDFYCLKANKVEKITQVVLLSFASQRQKVAQKHLYVILVAGPTQ